MRTLLSRALAGRPASPAGPPPASRRQLCTCSASASTPPAGPPVFVTTPIYYVNDVPHIGHAYTSVVADVYARSQRLHGRDVFLLTGTDEHGQKVEASAAARGVTPLALADANSAAFRRQAALLGVSHDRFIRTTEPAHVRQVGALVARLIASGDVYLGTFEGWYDPGQEEYLTEQRAKDAGYVSSISGKPLVRASEENYYFRLSAYGDRLQALYAETPGLLTPAARRNEMLARVAGGLSDVPVSRTNFAWGVPFPGDPRHVVYVWVDALLNYATALGLGDGGGGGGGAEGAADASPARFWPPTLHVMAKEIAWFHAVVWPAMLMALGLPLPLRCHAHAFWVRDGVKMSKSLGNFVSGAQLEALAAHYGRDGLRYFLAVDGPLGANDANFALDRLHDVLSSELVNTLGNCASRVTAMVEKYRGGEVPAPPEAAGGGDDPLDGWPARCAAAAAASLAAYGALELEAAARAAVRLVGEVDGYIQRTEPFALAKQPGKEAAARLDAVLYCSLEAVRVAGVLLEPVMPDKCAQLEAALGGPPHRAGAGAGAGPAGPWAARAAWGGLAPGTRVQKVALFPRCEPYREEGAAPAPAGGTAAAAAAAAKAAKAAKPAKAPKQPRQQQQQQQQPQAGGGGPEGGAAVSET